MQAYENRREHFNVILNKYMEYLKLYYAINNSSNVGAASFAEFYWRFTYFSRYANGKDSPGRGF